MITRIPISQSPDQATLIPNILLDSLEFFEREELRLMLAMLRNSHGKREWFTLGILPSISMIGHAELLLALGGLLKKKVIISNEIDGDPTEYTYSLNFEEKL